MSSSGRLMLISTLQVFPQWLHLRTRRRLRAQRRVMGGAHPQPRRISTASSGIVHSNHLRSSIATCCRETPNPDLSEAGVRCTSCLVEAMGLEPTTPCLQSRCSSQLSYAPKQESPCYRLTETLSSRTHRTRFERR